MRKYETASANSFAVLYITVNNKEISDFVQELRLIHFSVAK